MVKKIIVCSRSQEKTDEVKDVLQKYGVEVVSVADVGIENLGDVKEVSRQVGALVALDAANLTGECCVCDDCMLTVNALTEGQQKSFNLRADVQNSDKQMDDILQALGEKCDYDRNAVMTCVLVLAFPSNGDKKQEAHMFLGEVKGYIQPVKFPEEGNDFERIFSPNGYSQTLAQIQVPEKNQISHIGVALHELAAYLMNE